METWDPGFKFCNSRLAIRASCWYTTIRHVNEIPTMQLFSGIFRNTRSKSYVLSLTERVWDFQNNALWDTYYHALLNIRPTLLFVIWIHLTAHLRSLHESLLSLKTNTYSYWRACSRNDIASLNFPVFSLRLALARYRLNLVFASLKNKLVIKKISMTYSPFTLTL